MHKFLSATHWGSRAAFNPGFITLTTKAAVLWEFCLMPMCFGCTLAGGESCTELQESFSYCFPGLRKLAFTHMSIGTKPKGSRGLPEDPLALSLGSTHLSSMFPANSSYHGLPKRQSSNSLQFSKAMSVPFPELRSGNCHHFVHLLPVMTTLCLSCVWNHHFTHIVQLLAG